MSQAVGTAFSVLSLRDKGPRPTPKNLEWGTVEKMWLTTGGSLGANDIPNEFRDAEIKLKEMQAVLDVLTKRARAHQKSIIASTQACAALGTHMVAISQPLADLPLLAKTLNEYGEAFLAGINGHADLRSKIDTKYCAPIETLINEVVIPAQQSKRIWEGTKKDANAGIKKLEETYTVDIGDPLKIFITQHNVQLLQKKEVIQFEQTADLLCDTQWMRDFRFLQDQCSFMMENYESLLARYSTMYKLMEFEKNLLEQVTKLKQEGARKAKETEDSWNKCQTDLVDQKYDNLIELLSQPDLALLNSFLIVCAADQEAVLTWIVKIMDAMQKLIPLIEQGITNEVQNTKEAATLFRGNSTATKLMTNTTKQIGQHYLVILKPLLEEIQHSNLSYEVDPTKLKPGENLEVNLENLTEACQKIFDTIVYSVHECPLPFREMARHIRNEVGKRFPGMTKRTAVGGFVFLRFFCPAVSAPDSTKILEGNISPEARRGLILVGKVLQNLANGMKFGTKEAYMNSFNSFIDLNIERCERFLDEISTVPEDPPPFHLCQLAEAKATLLPELHKKLVQNMELVIKSLKSYKHNNLIIPFIQVLAELGDVDVAITPAPKSAEKKSGVGKLPFGKESKT